MELFDLTTENRPFPELGVPRVDVDGRQQTTDIEKGQIKTRLAFIFIILNTM